MLPKSCWKQLRQTKKPLGRNKNKKGVQQWSLVLNSLICCLLNNKSQASCDFMVLHFPSDIEMKMLALLRRKLSKNSQYNFAALTQPTRQQFGSFTKKLFSKPEISAAVQSCSFVRDTTLWGLHFQTSLPVLWHCTIQMWFCAQHSKFGNCHVQSVVKLLTEGLHQGRGKGWTSKWKPKWIRKQLLQYWTQESSETTGKTKSTLFSFKCSVKTSQN